MKIKSELLMRIIIAGFLSFLATLTGTEVVLYILWLVGNSDPTYQLVTAIIAGCFGLFLGGWVTTRVMETNDVWFSAINGLLVGVTSSYFLLGIQPLLIVLAVLSFVFSGLGGFVGLKKRKEEPEFEE
jgi:hypothetical protein